MEGNAVTISKGAIQGSSQPSDLISSGVIRGVYKWDNHGAWMITIPINYVGNIKIIKNGVWLAR